MSTLLYSLPVLALVSRTGCTDKAIAVHTDGTQDLDYTDVDLGLAQRGPHFDLAYSKNVTALVLKTAQLNCRVHDLGNRTEINYDSPRGGVSVITEKGETTTSHLLVQKARASDSGRYTCAPANANPRSVLVHVLSGEHPAAMQHGSQLRMQCPLSSVLVSYHRRS